MTVPKSWEVRAGSARLRYSKPHVPSRIPTSMDRWGGGVACLLLIALLAGCVTPQAGIPPVPPSTARPGARPVIVAMIDDGIQPYHESFALRDSSEAAWVRGLTNVTVVPSSFRAQALNSSAWRGFEDNKLYWFEGTRVLAISETYDKDAFGTPLPHTPIYDDDGHGTMSASVLARAAPSPWILMVQSNGLDKSTAWAAAQDWVDIMVLIQGTVADLPLSLVPDETPLPPVHEETPWNLLRATQRGQLVIALTHNDPAPSITGEDGVPWIISVGGANPVTHGPDPTTGTVPDVIAQDVDAHLANHTNLTGYRWSAGTSFAAPMVAGVAAEALAQTGSRLGPHKLARGFTAAQVREALNRTARYWSPTDYRPGSPAAAVNSSDPTNVTGIERLAAGTSVPALPAVGASPLGPWIQMGWGYIDESTLPALVACLRGNCPTRPTGAATYMGAVHALKETYWSVVPPG